MRYTVFIAATVAIFLTTAYAELSIANGSKAGSLPTPAPGSFIPGKHVDCEGAPPGSLGCCLPQYDYIPPLKYIPPGPHKDGDPLQIKWPDESTPRSYTTHCDGDGSSPDTQVGVFSPNGKGSKSLSSDDILKNAF